MFCSAFVARIATASTGNRVELFCRVDESPAAAATLPPEQNLGGFCFPVGPENVFPKEYSRPEVRPPKLDLPGALVLNARGSPALVFTQSNLQMAYV